MSIIIVHPFWKLPDYYYSGQDLIIVHFAQVKRDREIWFNLLHNSFDYLKIANEKDETFGGRNGKYCGDQYGSVSVTGQYAVLTFHSDNIISRKGYNLTFTFAPVGCKYCDILFSYGSLLQPS